LQRAGGRRYYRPEDVALVRRIHGLLNQDGYTIRGVQAVLGRERAGGTALPSGGAPQAAPSPAVPRARPAPGAKPAQLDQSQI
ncbi:MerR family transcriptional regulator, partial [Acinetobacter baumannii]